ncbi:M3 family oligoendopeptidase [Xylocopilactobacillus apicola]|uniref:Oligoendopeptidase F n=1 Tax=Xylocopilactobacillus apicola TaxID=2932184 RepID=A0AAU9D6Y9_9LACO|nr:M3 family oligoendopeptidase [Xylocopilactobacillus apicola]BDR58136.1 oligoendopeptidase F [Xylocopilactobacillus apicola]
MNLKETWDLSTLFGGDLDSPELKSALKKTDELIELVKSTLENAHPGDFPSIATKIQNAEAELGEISSFIGMWQAVHYSDQRVSVYYGKIQNLVLKITQVEQSWGRKLAELSETEFDELLSKPEMAPIAFTLKEQRDKSVRLLDPSTEYLLQKLQQDALDAWSSHYETIASGLSTEYADENGIKYQVSAGQALNLLDSIANPVARKNLMQSYEKMWGSAENLSGDTLNHLAGARLTDYEAHHYDNFLEYPLELNRMSRQTLDTMWSVVAKNKKMLVEFLNCKAKLLKLPTEHISWQDQSAPLNLKGYESHEMSFDEAAELIIKNFTKFSPKMGKVAQFAFEHQWIEAENRADKSPGGFETSLPISKEARIFLTFTGSVNDAATIGHELGHAFHTMQLYDLPYWRQNYAMNIAETASTFAETIINNANVEAATSKAEKLTLLDAKMVNAVAMFMNIHARYIFETNFYTKRQKQIITPRELNEMMIGAQKVAFNGAMEEYHPHFWTSKLHFYIDEVPFYNFPYTFGYLFSLGIYAFAQRSGADFEDQYIALLRDSANMPVEELAKKHLNVYLTKEDFWQSGADLVKKDIDEYLELAKDFI